MEPIDVTDDRMLKVAAVPFDTVWADVPLNIENATATMATIEPDTDIVVFPELFTTGFIVDRQVIGSVAEQSDGPTLAWAKAMAKKYNMAVAGSFLEELDGKFFNTAFFAEPEGCVTLYEKHHLFCLSPEAVIFGQGHSDMPVVEFRGWKVAMIVCYDLRFPVWCRNAGERYDIMLVPANWPQVRQYAWHHLLVARAIENQTPWVGANRGGSDDFGCYDALAEIVDPMGKVVARASVENPQAPVYATFSRNFVDKCRRKLPVGADADGYALVPEVTLKSPRKV